MEFWTWFGRSADILGIISFAISIATLCVTSGIRRAQLKHVEQSDYREDIDSQIKNLQAFHDLLSEKKGVDETLVYELDDQLLGIYTNYETILPRKLLNEIKALMNILKSNFKGTPFKTDDVRAVARRLTKIMAKLKKEKKLL